jgi:hypothetical protein
MRVMPRCAAGLGFVLLAALLGAAQAARADTPPEFARVTVLPGSGGAEPSIAADLSAGSRGQDIYVSSISPGANLWHTYDGGQSWSQPVAFDTSGPARGEDADVSVASDGTVYVADLNVSHTLVQSSTDHGQTFNSGSPSTPEADRPWITAVGASDVYVAYHDFASETVLVCPSTDRGATFVGCFDTFGANDPMATTNCTTNTDIGKEVRVDPTDGSLNIVFSCSTPSDLPKSPPYGPVHDYYMSKSTDGGHTWSTYTMFVADTSGGKSPTLSNFWTSFVIDDAGNYYALMDGTNDDNNVPTNPYHVYLLRSTDHGHTWSQPVVVDHEADGKGTHVLSDLWATSAGQLDIVFYGTTATGEPNGVCGSVASQGPCPNGEGLPDYTAPNPPGWRVSMAQTLDGLDPAPMFTQVPVTADFTHYGEICTNGIVCGNSDRSLLDYISVVVDCSGDAHVAFGGNPDELHGQAPQVYEADQTGGSALDPPAACGGAAVITPEGPVSVLLPLTGVALGGALLVARRRRRRLGADLHSLT